MKKFGINGQLRNKLFLIIIMRYHLEWQFSRLFLYSTLRQRCKVADLPPERSLVWPGRSPPAWHATGRQWRYSAAWYRGAGCLDKHARTRAMYANAIMITVNIQRTILLAATKSWHVSSFCGSRLDQDPGRQKAFNKEIFLMRCCPFQEGYNLFLELRSPSWSPKKKCFSFWSSKKNSRTSYYYLFIRKPTCKSRSECGFKKTSRNNSAYVRYDIRQPRR